MSLSARNGASSRAPGSKLSGGQLKKNQLAAYTIEPVQALTSNQGFPVHDNHNSLRAGDGGPALLEDFILSEKLFNFGHERIAERVVNARGCGAHGVFKLYRSMVQYTSAAFLNDPELETPVFVRFSTTAGSQGSSDTVRDVRGFAVKFYTSEGNYDLVGSSMPVFYIQDAIKFPDLLHALKPEPHHEMPQASSAHDTFWDFATLMPETTHMLMWTLSDRGLPRSLRMMEGFGVHAFRFVNLQGNAFFVKFHWKPKLGVHALAWDEAQKIAGKDPDFHRRDLWDAIENGHFPEWELGVQLIDAGKESTLGFDILDPTKLIPEQQVPVQLIGKLVLNRNPDNYFVETEQVAFHPGHLVPGIEFSNDPLLQGRLASYSHSQRARIGANFHELPINRSLCPIHNFQRGGHQRQTISKGRVAYEPNTLGNGSEFRVDGADNVSPPDAAPIGAGKLRRRSPSFDDHFSQATLFWNSQTAAEKEHLVAAFRFELSKVDVADIRQRMVDNLAHVDVKLAARVAAPLGIKAPDAKSAAGRLGFRDYRIENKVDSDPALSMAGRTDAGIKTRSIAIVLADGFDNAGVRRLQSDLSDAGAICRVVAPHLGMICAASGRQIAADHTFANMPSIMFDAVVIPGGAAASATLCGMGDAVHFVLEAYKHCKTICVVGEGVELLSTLGFVLSTNPDTVGMPTPGVLIADARQVLDGQVTPELIKAIALHRHWDRPHIDAVPA